jgi:hypothetical protein
MSTIKIAIASTSKYAAETYPRIVTSLLISGVAPNDIFFFIGGYETISRQTTSDGVHAVLTDHNSFDFGPLITISELKLKADYWFLIHDTSWVGEGFYKKLLNVPLISSNISLQRNGMSMNIGLYQADYINRNADILAAYKNKDYTQDGLTRAKNHAVLTEDILFDKRSFLNRSPVITHGPMNIYSKSVLRVVEEYSDIEIFKIKANWGQRLPSPIFSL